MKIHSRAPLVALAFGAIGGLIVGIGLPRTQAKAPAEGDAGQAVAARLAKLESRVATLEVEVKTLQVQSRATAGGPGFGGPSFNSRNQGKPPLSNIPPYRLIPLSR